MRIALPCLALLVLCLGARAVMADVADDVLAELKRGLLSKNTAARDKAITNVGKLSGHLDDRQKRRAAGMLNRAFERDGVPSETRRLMVKAMARLRHESGWVPLVNAAIGDHDPAIVKAARLAVFGGNSDLITVVGDLIRQEKNAAYRAQLLLLLGDRRRIDAVPLLLAQLAAKAPMVVSAAAEALEAISGQSYGYDLGKWRSWHVRFMEALQKNPDTGPSTAPTEIEPEEPPPHIGKALHPNFYGLSIKSKDVVFAVDISGSVGNDGVKRAKRELIKAVDLLGSDVNIGALFFSDKVHMWNKGKMVKATPANKEKLAFFLKGVGPGKRTDVFTAFNAALKIVQDRVKEATADGTALREAAALVVVSDGRHNAKDGVPIRYVEDKLALLDIENTVVHAIVLGGRHSDIMRLLALEGQGHYIVVPARD